MKELACRVRKTCFDLEEKKNKQIDQISAEKGRHS